MTPWTTLVPGSPRIAVASAGRGPLVLFLHGIGGNRNHWQHQLAFFSQHGFRAAAWDARGYGDSDDYEGALQFEDFTSDVRRTIDFLGEASVHLVGLSMGGRIARNFALAYPDRVRTLTLANTSPGFDALSAEEVLKFVEEREHRSADSAARLLGSRARPGAHAALLASFHALRNDSYRKTLEASVAQDRAAPLEKLAVPDARHHRRRGPRVSARARERMAQRIPVRGSWCSRTAATCRTSSSPSASTKCLRISLEKQEKQSWHEKRVAIVTGAGSGIGKSAALAMLKDGYNVGLVGRRKDMLEKTAAESGAKERAHGAGRPTSPRTPKSKMFSMKSNPSGAGSTCCSTTPAWARPRCRWKTCRSRNSARW